MHASQKLIVIFILSLLIGSCGKKDQPKPSDQTQLRESTYNLTCSLNHKNLPENLNRPIVIQVSLDAFRADYMQKISLPNLKKIASAGIYSPGLIPSFPTHTYPNHYTLVTGRRPAHHGILSNVFWDKTRNEKYDAFGDSSSDATWYQGDPIWNVVERNGMIAHTYQWVGSEVHINGQDPTCYAPYNSKITTAQRIDIVIEWLKLPAEKRPHYINTYIATIDLAGHAYGPNSKEVQNAAIEADNEIGRLWKFIQDSELPINIIITSDHGMQENYQDKIIFLGDKANLEGFKWSDKGASVMLYSNDQSRIKQAYKELKENESDYKVYLKNEIPKELNLDTSERVGDLLIISEPGHYMTDRKFNPEKSYRVGGGSHGWPSSNKSMHALFIAAGANIIKNSTQIPEFDNIDVYPFVMQILNVKTQTNFDGNVNTLRPYISIN